MSQEPWPPPGKLETFPPEPAEPALPTCDFGL